MFIVNYVIKDWKYYIIKLNWNLNQLLLCDVFDFNLFCVVEGNMVQLLKCVSYECIVFECEGYQVIFVVWDVGDIVVFFYNVIDVKFDGNGLVLFDWNLVG